MAENSLRYDQPDPSDGAHVLGMETCYCQVLSEVTGDGLWLCDLTMQIIMKKMKKIAHNDQVPVCENAACTRCLLNSACSNNFLAFYLHPSSAICFSDYFKIQVVCKMNLCMGVGWNNRRRLCANQVAAMVHSGSQYRDANGK